MLIFTQYGLAFIAVPKTGTTAVEMALKRKADIIITRRLKHTTAMRFHRQVAPFVKSAYGVELERFAVMREPEEQIRSWYRYRCREAKLGSGRSTSDISFNEFVEAVISDKPPHFAGIGSQYRMLTSPRGKVLVHHLFAYERQVRFRAFLSDRFGEEVRLKQHNVSPAIDAPLDPELRKRLRLARAREYELYDRLMRAGGHLRTEIG